VTRYEKTDRCGKLLKRRR